MSNTQERIDRAAPGFAKDNPNRDKNLSRAGAATAEREHVAGQLADLLNEIINGLKGVDQLRAAIVEVLVEQGESREEAEAQAQSFMLRYEQLNAQRSAWDEEIVRATRNEPSILPKRMKQPRQGD